MNRQEAQELLPWFVAGSLSEDEQRAVQAFIDSGEISTEEVREVSLFAESVAEPAEHEPAYNPQILQNAMAQLDEVVQEQPEEAVIVSESAGPAPGLMARLADAIGWARTRRSPSLHWALSLLRFWPWLCGGHAIPASGRADLYHGLRPRHCGHGQPDHCLCGGCE